jgi:hypothetical protein
MKRILLSLAIAFLLAPAFGQNIAKITLGESGNTEAFSIDLGDNVVMNLKEDGTIINWGFDVFKSRGGENYSGELQPYAGRVDYYPQESDAAFRGKIKYVGSIAFTYYASYDGDEFKGKIKSIGTNNFQYYAAYDDESYRGKFKSIGNLSFRWFASYENEAYRGKLMNAGNTGFTYFGSFDDKAYKGRVKTIDGSAFTYYSSFDRPEYRGRMKTGTQLQVINGIKYFVKN